jgi:hypothetical protein
LWLLSPFQFGDNPDKYPFPNIQDLSNGLHGCNVFSKVDLVKGYHQIPVAAADIPKTAIIRSFGLFEYLFTPFGLSNAAQTFQRMMDCTTDGLEGVFAYMDHSRVGSPDRQTHLLHSEAFFNALATNGLAINREKCVYAVPSLEILWPNDFGNRISPHGRSRRQNRIFTPPPPEDVKQLQRFLSIVSSPSGPLLKRANGQPILSWCFVSKTVQFQGKLLTAKFLQAAVAGPILGIDFLRKFRITVAPETSQVLFACMATAPANAKTLLPNVSPIVKPFVSDSRLLLLRW